MPHSTEVLGGSAGKRPGLFKENPAEIPLANTLLVRQRNLQNLLPLGGSELFEGFVSVS